MKANGMLITRSKRSGNAAVDKSKDKTSVRAAQALSQYQYEEVDDQYRRVMTVSLPVEDKPYADQWDTEGFTALYGWALWQYQKQLAGYIKMNMLTKERREELTDTHKQLIELYFNPSGTKAELIFEDNTYHLTRGQR